ncbi:hypothetical protein HJB56_15885 [Rhizobium lentis]|uniref:hypothetical protein n=1 Tax=Rhizobium lentis TaxID=1138194 RepID=UPI001A918A0C|nr:hypothetical protein [Rhizobium lentis]MBX5017987.1 hypothetical protein [Rhizobium lentis]MBX5067311.1 hypothetical protein [Rhizobium lentis]MBX5078240.1 hypothetical protein [Rhizobium lentis]MBX5084229.1 hypothetical protein [Rhizobium lentis]
MSARILGYWSTHPTVDLGLDPRTHVGIIGYGHGFGAQQDRECIETLYDNVGQPIVDHDLNTDVGIIS